MSVAELPPLPNLPVQLMLTLGCWLSSPFALQCAKSGLPPLSSLPQSLVLNALNPQALNALESALQEEARSRAANLLSGLLRYCQTPYARMVAEPPAIWQRGNARLLDYGSGKAAANAPLVLFVPSLINRYYILDLEEERSMLRYLAAQGLHPLVLDWGAPAKDERDYGCTDYITQVLLPAMDFLARASRQRVVLAGYCMGGVLSLAAASLKPRQLAGLALLATPWDFYCPEFAPFLIGRKWQGALRTIIESQPQVPADIVHLLFYLTDPWIFEQKFRRYAELQPESRAAKDFVALEHWVNDGVPMTARVARECLIGWAQQNLLARGQWKVADKLVDPARLNLPTLLAIPRNDHVVPASCAMPLAELMPHGQRLHPGAGHVGMIVGSHARRELWQPFAEWIATLRA